MNSSNNLTPIQDIDGTDLRVALDVDGVIADFTGAIIELAEEMGLDFFDHPTQWKRRTLGGEMGESFSKVWPKIKEDREAFWLGRMESIPKAFVDFPVACYVTARSQARDGTTQKWIFQQGFPPARVYRVDDSKNKLPILAHEGVDLFVEDKIQTVEMLQDRWSPTNSVPYPVLVTTPSNSARSKEDASSVWTRIDYLTELRSIAIPNQAQTYYRE